MSSGYVFWFSAKRVDSGVVELIHDQWCVSATRHHEWRRAHFLASEESSTRGDAEFSEQGQWCGVTFDGAGFHAIRTFSDAM